jgi:cytochrome c-type biogenesis protein
MDYLWIAAFGAGILSFLSPCVLPLVPPYLSYIAGVSVEEMQAQQRPREVQRRVMMTALLFVAGFATVFVALGASASALGSLLRAYLEPLSVLAGFAIIVMGLHFLGIFRLFFLYREWRPHVEKPPALWGAYIMGLAFAFGWTPCIGPVLGTILAKATTQSNVGQGAALLGVYAAGLGVPFLLSAFLTRPFARLMRHFKARANLIEKIMGLLLVLTGIAFLSGGIASASYFLLEMFPILGKLG